jgi:hypothetical protein
MSAQVRERRQPPALSTLLGLGLSAALLSSCNGNLPGRRGGDPTRVSDAPPSAPLQQGNNVIVNAVAKVGRPWCGSTRCAG